MQINDDASRCGRRMGLCVVRLKQGDPSIYGHSEEVLFFRAQGFEPLLVSGIYFALGIGQRSVVSRSRTAV
ncbi:uncharacterized protein LACBIDRAFT_306673 [Laccaria bicolor S238N-H82]|uniref:Predicted protein n=1 Tax=Laccaria bicolor (strain S238N-H82 / ATCC MYA-4686) TaxID=486041 RepID=B0DNI9_LACBS|nr:uncharacterized protein LACBIDRAFT_306673 [Laccaria bicolor S238N-H82]EDR03948.1 predicted protein [Laccaria bicolor S238N-H82]|eukprot:XP_001885516.1 predicted protein [Laccaria bicolor S238N-H82]